MDTKTRDAAALTPGDLYEALERTPGYLDVTPADLMELCDLGRQEALARLAREITAGELMTRQVPPLPRRLPLPEAALLLARTGLSAVPVVEADGTVSGILSESDFFRALVKEGQPTAMGLLAELLAGAGCQAPQLQGRVEDLMTAPAVCAEEVTSLGALVALFRAHPFHHLPVVDRERRLAGLVSRADVLELFGEA